MAKISGDCIFCEYNGDLTGEHLFADWMRKIFPIEKSLHERRHGKWTPNNFVLFGDYRNIKTPLQSQKMHIMCDTCNNKWGSNYQNINKSFLTKLMLGEYANLKDSDIENLSKWIVMTVMVSDQFHEEKIISKEDRVKFRQTGEIPENWVIYVGRYKGKHRQSIYKRSFLYKSPVEPFTIEEDSQITTILLGNLFIQAASTYNSFFKPQITLPLRGSVIPIYPFNKLDKNMYHQLQVIDDSSAYILINRHDIEIYPFIHHFYLMWKMLEKPVRF